LAVYLSDDGGAPVTLYGTREAAKFAESWIPFCRKYGLICRSPEAYFSSFSDDERLLRSDEFRSEESQLKVKYEELKKNIERFGEEEKNTRIVPDRSALVEIILDGRRNGENDRMPLLVYVSRERRPSIPHQYKAGNVNSLIRVSAMISNNPFLLVLDCDMVCNDPTSAKQAMCFHLDQKMSSLAFVQFPQIFYNVSKNDIYDGQARSAFKTKWQGMDGLRGPVMSGTGYYLKRKALFESLNQPDRFNGKNSREVYGTSHKFVESLKDKQIMEYPVEEMLKEAESLASCFYEQNTEWGKEMGYSYACMLESTFTGYILQCRGWSSVYLYPNRPCFLGCATIDMKDAMVQQLKWSSELFRTAGSKLSPLTYGVSRMSILHSMCYAYFALTPLLSIAVVLYGLVPQWGLLTGIPFFPKVSDGWFAVFAIVYVSSLFHHLLDVLSSNGTLRTWWNEQRIYIIRTVSPCLFGLVDAVLKMLKMKKMNLSLTNKAVDKEKLEKYEKGKFDLEGAAVLMVPFFVLAIWNTICLVGGTWRLAVGKSNFEEMFGQIVLISLALIMCYPILEGIFARRK
ncbi:cellulose synthase-like protein G2, partial [Momordica charantia]|uniref:Cellulose synthase-like protein G2 n=1 Tax=Momordica charantia TaxID=3673 RepID=A0A6J1CAM0_MOMCH